MISALLLVMTLQAAPAATAPAPPPPSDKAVGLASAFIVDACLVRLDTADTAAEYGAGSNKVMENFKAKFPDTAAEPVELDGGPKGDACRVTYHGPKVGELWDRFSNPLSTCTVSTKSATDIAMTCPATRDNAGATINVHRANGEFSETATWVGPRLP